MSHNAVESMGTGQVRTFTLGALSRQKRSSTSQFCSSGAEQTRNRCILCRRRDSRWLAVDDLKTLLKRLLQVHAAVHGLQVTCRQQVSALQPSTAAVRCKKSRVLFASRNHAATTAGKQLEGTCLVGELSDLLADAHELGQQVKCVVDCDGAVHIEAHRVLSGRVGEAGRFERSGASMRQSIGRC